MSDNKEAVAVETPEKKTNEDEALPPAKDNAKEVKSKPEKTYKRKEPSKYFKKFLAGLPDAQGKVIVITGTTSGTGLAATVACLQKGATVILLNRNEEKARKALEQAFQDIDGSEERTHFILCDLQDFESVNQAGAAILNQFPDGIDVICNNAGVMALEDKATKDGYDVQMQTNHLSHFLLTKLLFPLLEKKLAEKGEARIVNHSSTARLGLSSLKSKYFKKNGGKLGGNGNNMMTGARWERYHQTKLANSVFTSELQRRLNKKKINIFALCAHPGLASTELQQTTKNDGGIRGMKFMGNAQSADDGAMGILRCMLSDKVKKGALYGPRFLTGKATSRFHGFLNTKNAGKMLWRESEAACGEFAI